MCKCGILWIHTNVTAPEQTSACCVESPSATLGVADTLSDGNSTTTSSETLPPTEAIHSKFLSFMLNVSKISAGLFAFITWKKKLVNEYIWNKEMRVYDEIRTITVLLVFVLEHIHTRDKLEVASFSGEFVAPLISSANDMTPSAFLSEFVLIMSPILLSFL